MLAHAKPYTIAPIEVHADTLSQTGYVAHPTHGPWEALETGRQLLPQYTGFRTLWDAFAAIMPYVNLAEAIADGTFIPEKAFAFAPEMLSDTEWLEKVYHIPFTRLHTLPNGYCKNYLSRAIQQSISDAFGLSIYLRNNGLWDVYTNGLEAYQGATLGEAIQNAQQIRPYISYILAFRPAKPLRYCKPCRFWLAERELGHGPIYLFELKHPKRSCIDRLSP